MCSIEESFENRENRKDGWLELRRTVRTAITHHGPESTSKNRDAMQRAIGGPTWGLTSDGVRSVLQ
jgi:hypothetical protein